MGEFYQKIAELLTIPPEGLGKSEDKNFIGFFEMDHSTKSQLYENFIELTVIFVKILKFIIGENLTQLQNNSLQECKYHLQAKNCFRIIEKLSLLVASPRIYLLLLSLFVDENKVFFEKFEIATELPSTLKQS